MNEMIAARMSNAHSQRPNAKGQRWNGYSDFKKKWQNIIAHHAFAQKFPAIESGYFTYLFVEPNRQRNPSNVQAGAVKLIEDALVECKLMPNDGWKQVQGICGHMTVDDGDGVLLVITEDDVLSRPEIYRVYVEQKGRLI